MVEGRIRNHSLKNQLILYFILLVTIPSFVIGLFSYIVSSNAIEEKISSYSRQIVRQTANQISMLLNDIENISLQIVTMDEISEIARLRRQGQNVPELEESMRSIISKVIASRTDIVGVNIIFPNSLESMVFGEPLIEFSENSPDNMLNELSTTLTESTWSTTYRNPNPIVTYTYISTFSRPIIDELTGETIAVLLIGVKEFALADTYSYLDIGPSGFSLIVDGQGTTVSDLDKTSLGRNSNLLLVDKALSDNNPEQTFAGVHNGERVLVAYEKIAQSGWYLISSVPYSYLLQEVSENGTLTLQVSFGFVIVAIILALLISRHIFRPIDQLNSSIKALGKGKLSTRVKLRGQNEITELAASFDKMAARIETLINEVYESRLMKQEAEIKALHAQINPHFLYNTLALIDGMALQNGQTAIAEVTQILSDIFRYSTSGQDQAQLKEELYQSEQYLKIHALRHRGKFEYEIRTDESIADCVVPKLLVQPIVENAIRHGLDNRLGHNRLIIETKRADADTIEVTIRDNGSGFSKSKLTEIRQQLNQADTEIRSEQRSQDRDHIGMINVHKRIVNYFGSSYGLMINSIPGIGAEVTLRLGIRQYQQDQLTGGEVS
jgi:two-component system sensor histidine kinase YesM